jgi:cytochrome P450 family 144
VLARVIGLPEDDVPRLLPLAYQGTELLAGLGDLARLEELASSAVEMAAYLAEHYATARRSPGDDLLGDLARAAHTGGLTDDEAVAMLVQLVGAGGESTAGLIGNAARRLAEDAALQSRLRATPELVPALLEEVLRLDAPFRGHYRAVRRDTQLGGVTLPAGSHLILLWGAANRDPAQFDRPDGIDLNRPAARSHLAFGKGLHFCVGAGLARMEAHAAITELLVKTSSFTVDPDAPARWEPSIFVRRQASLTLRITPNTG